MGLYNIVRSKGYKQFMAKLYGWGAAVVIIGALFKINHYPGANFILIIGLGTEACIFFFSAFEPLHTEYDWSLVYPELAGMEELDKKGAKKSLTQELDKMLEDAKIGPELIASLGEGMRNLGENANKLSGISTAASATDGYAASLNQASESVKTLSASFAKTATGLDKDAVATEDYLKNIQAASNSASNLTGTYDKVASALNIDLSATDAYVQSVKNATASAQSLADKYTKSAESLTKSAEAIDFSKVDAKNYGDQIQKLSKSLSELNAVYELQLVGTKNQLDKSNQMQATVEKFLGNLNDSVENTAKYKDQVAVLAKNLAALNNVYGNMLSAMNVKA
jgi:gliding motility-associated protein GldL